MKTARPYELVEKIYNLCVKEQYFTCGTSRQYDLMFSMTKNPEFSTRDIAVMIWTCSKDADLCKIQQQIEQIQNGIEEAEALCRLEEQQAAAERAADEVYCGYYD